MGQIRNSEASLKTYIGLIYFPLMCFLPGLAYRWTFTDNRYNSFADIGYIGRYQYSNPGFFASLFCFIILNLAFIPFCKRVQLGRKIFTKTTSSLNYQFAQINYTIKASILWETSKTWQFYLWSVRNVSHFEFHKWNVHCVRVTVSFPMISWSKLLSVHHFHF